MSTPDDLMQDFFDQTLDADRAESLNRYLRDDDEALDQFILLNHVHTRLHERLGKDQQWVQPEPAKPDDESSSRRGLSIPSYFIALAAAIALALTAWFVFLPEAQPENPAPVVAPGVALLTNLDEAVFIDAPSPPTIGGELPPGVLYLQSGRAQVMFKSGAVVDLTGPVEFQMIEPNRGRLSAGTFEAYVPRQAAGFTVDLPHGMRVVDLGTRFGIEMTAGGTGQIRVTEGTVQLQWPAGRRTIGAGFDCVIGPEGPRHVTPFSILALAPNDMRGGITTTTPGLQTAGAPAGASRDNAWGFSDTNEQARLGRAATESAALAGHVWVARNDLGENAPRLTTTIIGLDDARRYNVYAYYVTHDQLPWLLRAGATGGPMTTCDRAGALIQSGGSSGNIIQLRRLIILPDVAPTGGMLSIDIDDAPSSQSGDVRCFYKGLGVQAIDPPSAPATSPDQPHLPDNPPDPVNRGAKS